MPENRYIVMFGKRDDGRPPLRGILSDFPGVSVLREDGEQAVVKMDAATAKRLVGRYPFLELEEDVRHQRARFA